MRNLRSIFVSFFIIGSSIPGYSQYANLEFIENKGQWDNRVKFMGSMNNGAFYLEQNGFRVLQHNSNDLQDLADYFHGHTKSNAAAKSGVAPGSKDSVVLRSHSYTVQFANAGNPAITPDKPLPTYNNYYIGNDQSKWQSNCKIYQAVAYSNIYPGIDARYYTSDGNLKYDLFVKPGADASRIIMKYDGIDGLQVKNEQLIIKTSVGEMKEMAPYAYQIINGVKKEVGCRFKVTGKSVQFSLENYSKTETLVIDPSLIFSTFTGSTADNWGYTATYGPDGTFYAGGIVFAAGFPTSPGAFQTTFQGGSSDEEGLGGYDIGIMKFNANGTNRLYATYIGGNGNEHPHSLIVDAQGNLIIGGRTNSGNFPTTTSTFGPGGGYDIILTKLNAAGTALIGSRKIGGSQHDGINIRPKYQNPLGAESIRRNYGDDSRSEVIIDASNNIYLSSCTHSINFPVTPGAFQQTFGGGRQDAVVIKASPDLNTILFSSFLGGNNDDAAFVLALHPTTQDIYVGGNTVSPDFPGNKSGVLYPSFQGGICDGYVSIINNSGTSLLKTSFMGTSGADMLYGIQIDRFGFPYIMGTTTGNWPVQNATFRQTGGKQFISKLKPDLSGFEYSTIFGTNSASPNLSPTAFLVDRCENVYVSGWGGMINNIPGAIYPNSGTSGLIPSQNAIQNTTDGSDFYFFVLEKDATKELYSSFFGQFSTSSGGEHVDGGTSRFDRNGVIYQAICANCGRSATFPTTPGVWSQTNNSTQCNLAAVKIAFNLAGIGTSIRTSIDGVLRDTSGCLPLKVDFTDTIGEGKKYIWNFGDGSPDVTTTTPSTSHTFNSVGTFRVRLISIDSLSCNISDTAYTFIRARNDEASVNFTPVKLPPCQSTLYQFVNNSVPPAGKPFKANSFKWIFGDNSMPIITGTQTVTHNYPASGTYTVKLILQDTNYCNAPDTVEKIIRVAPNVKADFTTPPFGCAPYRARFNNISAGGTQFFWNFGDGNTSTQTSPTHTYTIPGVYTVQLIAVDSSTCNFVDTTRFTITVSQKPKSAFVFTPVPPQPNTPVTYFNTSIGGTIYRWSFGDGDTLVTTSTQPINHTFNETKLYQTCLVVTNQYGCADTSCQNVQARITPLLDVSNAFTPNGDGVNDKVFVRGFGISKMTWRIYNRWGTLVFQTADRNQGWDGTYKGQLQPKEVYHYVLDVEFSDGSKHQKKGDITLL